MHDEKTTCCFTGHRPDKLPWGAEEDDPRCIKVKQEIAKAVETLFDVKVSKVNTISVRGRSKRMGRFEGYTASWKKAIVTLTEDSKGIEFFESMM